MSETNGFNGLMSRINSLLLRIHSNLSSIGSTRNRLSSSSLNRSMIRRETSDPTQESEHSSEVSQQTDERHERPERRQTYSLFGSCNGSEAIPASHSELRRHSSHYPLLLGAYNCSLSGFSGVCRDHCRDHTFVTHFNNSFINREKDRNVLSAIMSIIVIATLATALAQPKWFSISGGLCNRKYIGLQEFFYVGSFNTYQFNRNTALSAGNTGLSQHFNGSSFHL